MLTRRHFLATAALPAGIPCWGAGGILSDRPVHIIVGYAAGGGVDISARLLSEPMKSGARPIGDCREPHRRQRDDRQQHGREGDP